ncbi:hypothetical protein SESBI_46024 [Sesbania bispinosa]|nr:hypothetical protein SESBI_46024 [Sesbania bispinosa]
MDSKEGSNNIPEGDFHEYILDVARRGCTCYFQVGMLDEGLESHPNPDVRATYNWVADALAKGKQEWENLYGFNKTTDAPIQEHDDDVKQCEKGKDIEKIMNKFKKDNTTEVDGEGCSKNM